MINVVHMIDSFGIYGAEIMLLNLMEEQKKLGLNPILLSFQPRVVDNKKTIAALAEEKGIKVECSSDYTGNIIKVLKNIRKFIKSSNVSIVHSHGYKGNIYMLLLPRIVLPVVRISTMHGWIETKLLTKIWVYRMLDRLALRNMDAVVNVNSVSPVINAKKGTFVVKNGIKVPEASIDYVKNTYPEDYEFCTSGVTLGVVSRLSGEKGLEYIIRAMHKIVKYNSKVNLIVIGGGPEKISLLKLVEQLGLSKHIKLCGYRENAFNYLSLFDVFVLPSLSEGLPMTLLEAMNAQVPIVASSVGGIPEVLNDGVDALLVKPANSDSLFEAICKILDGSVDKENMVRRAYTKATNEYSVKNMTDNYLSIYRELI